MSNQMGKGGAAPAPADQLRPERTGWTAYGHAFGKRVGTFGCSVRKKRTRK